MLVMQSVYVSVNVCTCGALQHHVYVCSGGIFMGSRDLHDSRSHVVGQQLQHGNAHTRQVAISLTICTLSDRLSL